MKMLVVMGIHHIFGVIIIVPVLLTDLYLDQNLQLIGIALLLAGAVSCLGLVISRTMDRRVPMEAWMDFLVWLVNLSFFTLCRFYVFPQQLYLFFEKTNWETNYLLIVGAICMLMFNILILLDCLKSTFVRLSIALKNGEKHSFSESCHCGKCKSLTRSKSDTKASSSDSIAFMRFFKEFQIITPQQTGAIGNMGAAKLAWKVLDKTDKAKYIEDVEAERGRSGMTRSWVEKQKVCQSTKKSN